MFKLSSLYAMLALALGAQIAPRGRVNPFARPSQPPEAARYWHAGSADPIQAARIEAAAVKRARRADKLHEYSMRGMFENRAHRDCVMIAHDELQLQYPNRLNPFYLAK